MGAQDILKVVATLLGGGLAGSIMTFVLSRAHAAYTRPRVHVVLSSNTFTPPVTPGDLHTIKLTMGGTTYASITLSSMQIMNESVVALLNTDFFLRGTVAPLAHQVACSPVPTLPVSVVPDSEAGGTWVRIPSLNPGDSVSVLFVFGRTALPGIAGLDELQAYMAITEAPLRPVFRGDPRVKLRITTSVDPYEAQRLRDLQARAFTKASGGYA